MDPRLSKLFQGSVELDRMLHEPEVMQNFRMALTDGTVADDDSGVHQVARSRVIGVTTRPWSATSRVTTEPAPITAR